MVRRSSSQPVAEKPAVAPLPVTDQQFLKEQDLAQRWAVSCKLLQKWRQLGEGPPYLKLCAAVRYALSDVVAFEKSALR